MVRAMRSGGRSSDEVAREIVQVAHRFRERAEADERLKLLLLVDPIRAFGEIGLQLSAPARRRLRKIYPWLQKDQEEVFDAIREGTLQASWIRAIHLGETPRFPPEADSGSEMEGSDV
ncbi:MAG: hypothetical protein ACQETX_05110 [Pseudomonadota bacterium]